MKFEDVQLTGSLNVTGSFNVPVHSDYSTATSDGDLFYHSVSSSLFVRNDDEWVLVPFSGSTAAAAEESGPAIADIEYLVVAGGGGGGSMGGGGAGGLLSSSLSQIESGSSITVTVGAGGSGQIEQGGATPNSGTDSSIASAAGTSFTTVTSTGGGHGGGSSNAAAQLAEDGGSGGGGGGLDQNPATEGSGTVGQGNDGGTGRYVSAGTSGAGGGGGGAGEAGGAATGNTTPGDGGDGKQSSITGTSTYYAGGGGGGSYSYGGSGNGSTGGQGGGTNGSSNSGYSSNGTANTGGGAGSGGFKSTGWQAGSGAGGSGVVILAYPSSSVNAVGGIVGDAGNGRKYHQFNESGTFKVSSTSDFGIVTNSLGVNLDAGNFDSRGTSTWTDLQGNYNVTNNGATLGNNFYYSFDGSNDYMTIGAGAHSTYINPSQDYSSEAWIKLTGATTDYVCLMFANSTYDIVANVVRNNAGTVGAFSYHKYETNATYEPTFSDDADWHHYVFSYASSGTMTIYRDGSELGNGSLDTRSAISSPTMSVGGTYTYNGTRYYRTGNLAQLRYYSKALSASEALQNYNATKTNFV